MADVLDSLHVAPEAVRLLVVDTEGHDHVILNSLDYTVSTNGPVLYSRAPVLLAASRLSVYSQAAAVCTWGCATGVSARGYPF